MIANPEFAAFEAMAQKFRLPSADFLTFPVMDRGGAGEIAVAYAAPEGIDKGSWNQIFTKEGKDDYLIVVDGVTFDTRAGMTFAVYKAMLSYRVPLTFDLRDGSTANQPWTYLTGERAPHRVVPVAAVYPAVPDKGIEMHANFTRRNRREGFHNARFRPAVILGRYGR